MFDNYRNKFIPLILPICIIIFWYLITEGFGIVNPYILPGPIEVCKSAWELIVSGKLLSNTLDTLYKVFGGLILAAVVAIPLGILMGWYKTLEDIATLVICGLESECFRQYSSFSWDAYSRYWSTRWMVLKEPILF